MGEAVWPKNKCREDVRGKKLLGLENIWNGYEIYQ